MTGAADDMVADMVQLLRQAVAEGRLPDVQVHYEAPPRATPMVSVDSSAPMPLTLLAHAMVSQGWRKAP